MTYADHMIPGVLFKIQAKSLQSASRVLPHDRAFCCLLHINNQLFVEVQAATMGMNYCWGYRDKRLLEACSSKMWKRQWNFNPVSFIQWSPFVLSGLLGFRFIALQSLRLILFLDVFTESWPFHWSAEGKGLSWNDFYHKHFIYFLL